LELIVENLSVRFGHKLVLDRVTFTAMEGERLGIVGESGVGKSTLAKALTRLVPVQSGGIWLGGTPILGLGGRHLKKARRRFQVLFQNPYATLDPAMTVADHVLEAIRCHEPTLSRQEAMEKAAGLLDRVGLAGRGGALPGELSGGQRRRASLARVLATSPELLIVDEPTTGLDALARAEVLDLLREVAATVKVFILITHDLRDVRALCTRVLVLYQGLLVEDRPVQEFRPGTPTLHPYAASLLAAEQRLAPAHSPPAAGRGSCA